MTVARALLALLLVGCGAGRPAAPANTARARSICPQQPLTLNFLQRDLVTDLTLDVARPGGVTPERWKGFMVVDGTVTDAMWPEESPRVYALADGRRLLHADHADVSYIWDPRTRTLTPLGKVTPVFAGRFGYWLARYTEEAYVYGDIDPARDTFREILRVSPDKHVEMLGELDGAIVALEMLYSDYQSRTRKKRHAATLICVSGPARVTKRAFSIPAGLRPVTDGFRGHRLLMRGPATFANGGGDWTRAFTVDVFVVDLDRRGLARKIGTVPGAYTHHTAVPHPYVNVQWGPQPPVKPETRFGDYDVTYYVDPVTEAVR